MQSTLRCSRCRRVIAFPVGCLVVLACALMIAVSTIDTANADRADTHTLTLEPGDNFVGWVAEPIAVADIFRALPEAELIYRWDADQRSYQSASREHGGKLTALEPGMAAMIRIDGDKSAQWERPLTPAKGMITLYRGVNWVTWVGRDEWSLDQVARGIGQSLIAIRVGDLTYPAPLDDSLTDLPVLHRGDALQVTVSRDLRWLQPTGMMSKIMWAGEPSQSLQEEVRGDIRAVLDFLAEEFAVESDFSETTILLFRSIDAAVGYAESGAEPRLLYSPERLRSVLETGWQAEAQPWGFFMWACGWESRPPPACHGNKAPTLAHEWFHVLQDQLSTRHPHLSPTWMSEGTATWLNWRLPAEFASASYEDQRQWAIDRVARTTEPLRAGENGFYRWVYDLGSVVAERLVEKHGIDSLLEFDRWLYPQLIGEERRYVREPTWREAFEGVFGLTVEAFYDEFASWRETLPEPERTREVDPDDVQLSGTIHHSDGSAAIEFIVFVQEHVGEIPIGLAQTSVVNEAGEFAFHVGPETIQRLRLAKDACELWLTENGFTTMSPQPGEVRDIDAGKPLALALTLPDGACDRELHARLTRLRDDERSVEVSLFDEETHEHTRARVGSSGVSVAYAPRPGSYLVEVMLGSCRLYYAAGGLVASWEEAERLDIAEGSISIEIRVPETLCVRQLSGRVVHEDGTPVRGVHLIAANREVQGYGVISADGSFTITVPDSRDYNLFFYDDGCSIDYSAAGATNEWDKITWIDVGDADVTDIEFRVPQDPADLCRLAATLLVTVSARSEWP